MPGRVSDRVALQPQGRGILEDVSANEFAPGNTRTTPVTAGDIELAAQRISGAVRATPLERSERLSDVTGANVRLKREDLQSVRSYKIRGAFNFLASLDSDQRLAGVVTASAGNHAQGVAWSCRQLGIHGSIYVPENTPKQKRDRIRAFGGDFVDLMVTGENFDAAQDAALAHSADYDSAMVPPFDHPETIAGQGTIGVEILEQLDSSPDLVVIPVGGGGLLAGIATYLSEKAPECKIVAVEPSGAASLTAASNEGHQVTLTHVDTFVDGASVKRIGDNPWATYQALAGNIDVRTVDEGAVCTEMLELYQTEGIIAEPAGALSTTIVKDLRIAPDSNVVCIPVRRQQRRVPVQRSHRTLPGSQGAQALLPGQLPAGARTAAQVPQRGSRAGRRHHPIRVPQAKQSRYRHGARGHRARARRGPRCAQASDGFLSSAL